MVRFLVTVIAAAIVSAAFTYWLVSQDGSHPRLKIPTPTISAVIVEEEFLLEDGLFNDTGKYDPLLEFTDPEFGITHYLTEEGVKRWAAFARGHEGQAILFVRDQVILGWDYIDNLNPDYIIQMRFVRDRLTPKDHEQISTAWQGSKFEREEAIYIYRLGESLDMTADHIASLQTDDQGTDWEYGILGHFTPRGEREFWSLMYRNRGSSLIFTFDDRMISWPMQLYKTKDVEGNDVEISDVRRGALGASGDFDEDFTRKDFERLKDVYGALYDPEPIQTFFEDVQ